MLKKPFANSRRQSGVTMVEILVALSVGSFLMIGAVQVYNQSRHAFVINESIARVQETAQFAMDTIEADLRMTSNWGMSSRGSDIEGRSLPLVAQPNPNGLTVPAGGCGAQWALELGRPIEGNDNGYNLTCAAVGGSMPNSDIVTTRRGTVAAMPLENGRLQIQSNRMGGELMDDGVVPALFDPLTSETHNLLVNSYYVANDSPLIPGVPTLRRKTLVTIAGVPTAVDQEVAPGVENMQLMFGVDVDSDNTVDRYVIPGHAILDPADVAFIPGARVIAARIWLVVRGISAEAGITDNTDYRPGNVVLGTYTDNFRRMMVSKTILMRNARS